MTKTDFLKKLKAGLLAGTMAATLSACGHESEKEKNTNETTIAVEDTTKETKTTSVEYTTKDEKETATKEKTTDNDTEIVENTTKENGESKTNNTTTKNNINNNTTQTNRVTTINHSSNTTKNNTTPVVTQTPVTTKQQVTTKTPTTTTKAAPVTQAPVTTAAPVTQAPVTTVPYDKRTYTKTDLTSDDEVIARFAMEQLEEELASELFNGYVGPKTFAGGEEACDIITALNANQNINRNMVGHFNQYNTREEFINSCDILELAFFEYKYNSSVDYSKYVLDEKFADFIEKVCEEYKEYMCGNMEPLSTEFAEYFDNNSGNINNYIEYYFMCKTKSSLEINTPELEEARQLYIDEVLLPLADEYEPNKHYIRVR